MAAAADQSSKVPATRGCCLLTCRSTAPLTASGRFPRMPMRKWEMMQEAAVAAIREKRTLVTQAWQSSLWKTGGEPAGRRGWPRGWPSRVWYGTPLAPAEVR